MTEVEFDKLLRSALMEAVWQDFSPAIEAAEHEAITFSKHYLKQREKMLQDPFAYAKKATLSFMQRVARTAAMILLVCSILFAVAMTVPEVRAAIKKLYMEWYETHIAVYVQDFERTSETDLSKFHVEIPPEVLPEGYREMPRTEHSGIVKYTNDKYGWIIIDYHSAEGSKTLKMNGEKVVGNSRNVDGTEYYLTESTDGDKASRVLWLDEEYNLIIGIVTSGNFGIDQLLSLAQNISIKK